MAAAVNARDLLGRNPCGWAVALCLGVAACHGPTDPDGGSFAGQTVRIVVNRPPGGSYDSDARLVARHLGRHLEGNPQVIVENMPGAAGLAAPVFLATRAPENGLALGFLGPELILAQLDDASRPDVGIHDLVLLGSPSSADRVCVFSRRSGITDFASWKGAAVPPKVAAMGRAGPHLLTALVLKDALGLPMQIVQGYAGSAEVRLAVESGEVDGACAAVGAFELFLQSGDAVVPVLKATSRLLVGMEHLPDALSLAESEEARELIRVGIDDIAVLSRVVVAPTGVPAARLAVLERALKATFDDPELRREAQATGMVIAPISGDELRSAVERLLGPGPGRDLLKRVVAPD